MRACRLGHVERADIVQSEQAGSRPCPLAPSRQPALLASLDAAPSTSLTRERPGRSFLAITSNTSTLIDDGALIEYPVNALLAYAVSDCR
jgi:hypothetical protein